MTQLPEIVILANGLFPSEQHCLSILKGAEKIICCDGAADKLIASGLTPQVIIGDLDSLSDEAKSRHASILIRDEDQESNDLTKAVRYCMDQGHASVSILGATGLREDHTLGNISLMLEYFPGIELRIISDFGSFFLAQSGEIVKSFAGEKVSIFSVDNRIRVSAIGLKYPLEDLQLSNWYTASLNESTSDQFILYFESDLPLIVYKAWD
jgi:thiamine pyrophosphokinase